MKKNAKRSIEKVRVPAPVRLSLLWASLMSLYIYNDYLVMFTPGMIDEMSAGSLGPLGEATDLTLLGVAVVMAIPASMIFLSSMLPSHASRWLNMLLGAIYTAIQALTLFGSPPFYQFIVSVEIIATLLIIWTAARWPVSES
ncbi:DUF6326 family protein [Glycocaulis abyssi]|uniref:DUF6326 family protein n=1 Tax=Glycocaulis abyssi TaxID=1433403 RepID=A0ABV9N823_9PROT